MRMCVGTDGLVDDVMRAEPRTIRVFLAFQMGCVGCPLACFHTVADACREHSTDCAAFLAALHDCAKNDRGKWQPSFRKDHAQEAS
jgi:hybrid cluster-associated redox disulfide protein